MYCFRSIHQHLRIPRRVTRRRHSAFAQQHRVVTQEEEGHPLELGPSTIFKTD